VLAASDVLDVTVAYATSLSPFDHAGLRSIAGGSPRVIVVEPFYEGTSAPVLAETFRGAPAAVAFIGVPRAFIHGYGTAADLDADVGLDVPGLHVSIAAALA
jgi:transketolase